MGSSDLEDEAELEVFEGVDGGSWSGIVARGVEDRWGGFLCLARGARGGVLSGGEELLVEEGGDFCRE